MAKTALNLDISGLEFLDVPRVIQFPWGWLIFLT